MLEVLQYIFSSFWIWLGTAILCSIIFGGLGSMFNRVVNITKKDHKETEDNVAK